MFAWIPSAYRQAGELAVFLKLLQTNFHIIVLTEIGARNISTVEHLLDDYGFRYTLLKNDMYGGVGLYLSKDNTRKHLKQSCMSLFKVWFWINDYKLRISEKRIHLKVNIPISKREYGSYCRWSKTNAYGYQWVRVLYTCWIHGYWYN